MTQVVDASPKLVEPIPITPPPASQRAKRNATFAKENEKRTRYSLPNSLQSASPVGYRTRVSMSDDDARRVLPLLSLDRPTAFGPPTAVREQELFEECSLGVLSARQSTNFRGHRSIVFGPEESKRIGDLLRRLERTEAPVLDNVSHTHVVLTRPYRTPFTLLLTFIGHRPLVSLLTVPLRGVRKRLFHVDDMPTIGYLQQLHLGVLADAMERATVIASAGQRRAQIFAAPFAGLSVRERNRSVYQELERLCGLTTADHVAGWRIGLVAQVGEAVESERVDLPAELWRKLGANLIAFRSERIQPGVNQEEKAPAAYQKRQDMGIPEELRFMAGRAAYNAFCHWTGCDRERSKELLLLERVDVLSPNGKERLREIRSMLDWVTDEVVKRIPLWADLPTLRAFSKNAARGRKAFALAGQRIYIAGLAPEPVRSAGIEWDLAVRAVGSAAARASLVAELMGSVNIPDDCDLLAGTCLMAGPVNQNDVGKTFFGQPDLLEKPFPEREATSLIVWTLKAKTVADPIGNEEQLMNAARKGALVDLRPGPHEVVAISGAAGLEPMRKRGKEVNTERAFGDVGNFVTDPSGREIPGNVGGPWPGSDQKVW